MSYLNELIRVLCIEQDLYVDLTKIAQEKQKVIIANDIEELADCLTREQQLIEEIESVEKERRQAVIGLSAQLNLPEKELSFSKLRVHLDSVSREKLDQFKENLLKILEELHNTNETNRMLIAEALKINDFTIQTLTQAAAPSSKTYDRSGVDKAGSQRLIDKRA